jgi:hypothetical protein
VGFRRNLAFSGLAACACLSGLHAQSIYSIPFPEAGTPAKFELYVTYSPTDAGFNHAALEFTVPAGSLYTAPAISFGDWEVTVSVDLTRCGIYCAYRRKREASGRTSLIDLLPPITAIRVYTGSAAKPAIMFVDPAGLRLPAATRDIVIARETICIPGRRFFQIALAPQSGDKSFTLPPVRLLSLTHRTKTIASAALSLRI